MELGRTEEAAEAFRRAAWLNPRFAIAHYNLALALQKLGKLEEAKRSMLRAHRIWPARWPKGLDDGSASR
jgi:tetratricopeptide (TPR) repeat protein